MKDDIFTIRTDIQHCIVNNMELDTEYRVLLFEDDTMPFTQSLGCFENLEIEPSNTKMRFKGNIAKDLDFSEEEILKIKKLSWMESVNETMQQIAESKKSENQKENERIIAEMRLEKLLNNIEDLDYKYRKANKDDKEFIINAKEMLNEMCSLDLDYEEHEEALMLSGNFKYLNFNKQELRALVKISEYFDMFLIAPVYSEEDEESDECEAIRIVFGIDLREE